MTCVGWDNGSDYGYTYSSDGGAVIEYDLEDNDDALESIDSYSHLISDDIDMMMLIIEDSGTPCDYDPELNLLENLQAITKLYNECDSHE